MISGPFFVLAGSWVWLCLCVMAQMFVWWDIAKANHMDRGCIGSGKCLHQLGRKRVFGKACTVNIRGYKGQNKSFSLGARGRKVT